MKGTIRDVGMNPYEGKPYIIVETKKKETFYIETHTADPETIHWLITGQRVIVWIREDEKEKDFHFLMTIVPVWVKSSVWVRNCCNYNSMLENNIQSNLDYSK